MDHELYRKLCTDYDLIFENIVDFTCDYINNSKIETLVLGMSGGIDSTLTAALAREVVDRCIPNVKLKGLIIPIESNESEMARAQDAAKAFCHHFELKDMINTYISVASHIMGVGKSANKTRLIRQGNIKARLRMIQLYDTAQKMNGLVLSTDNYTEYLLGFWTLHGDVGDYGMMQNLWKTEVYGLARFMLNKYKNNNELRKALVLLEGIEAMPTDGLGISNTDFDQIHPNYNRNDTSVDVYGVIDAVLLRHLNEPALRTDHKVIQRHKATEFKRINPFSIPRENIVG